MYYQDNYQNGATAPGTIDGDSGGQTIVISSANGTDNDSNVSTCPIAFIGGAAVEGSEETGWTSIAQVVGFDTKRLDVDDGITMPYYIERKDYTKAQRIVVTLQGKPRDAWRYPNLMRYSGMCAVANPDWDTNMDDYIISAPIILNTDDLSAGAAISTDLVWHKGLWASGGITKGPGDASWTPFKALDKLVDYYFNTTVFPNVKSVVIAGHSAGAILGQRYAMLREKKSGQDENMKWWISNAGSYAWPVNSRPVTDPAESSSCKTDSSNCAMTPECNVTMNEWPYGMNVTDPSTMNVYARERAQKDVQGIIDDFYDRRIQYTYASLDDGAGDTHCEAQFQGDSHITRGTNLEAALKQAGAKGASWTFVANATHVDEELYIDPGTQEWIFVDGLTDARNGSTDDSSSTSSSSKSTSTSGSNKDTSGAAPAAAAGQALVVASWALGAFAAVAAFAL